MKQAYLFLSVLLILLLSFLSYKPSATGAYYRLDSGESVQSWDEREVYASFYDVEGDGDVDQMDLRALQRALDGWQSRDSTDINLDGATDTKDRDLLLAYLEEKQQHSTTVLKNQCQPGQILCFSSQSVQTTRSSTYQERQTSYFSCAYDLTSGTYRWGTALQQCPTGTVCSTTTMKEFSGKNTITTPISQCTRAPVIFSPRPTLYR